jgi:uncharacterized protein YneF (UPF0154 family)
MRVLQTALVIVLIPLFILLGLIGGIWAAMEYLNKRIGTGGTV